MYSSSNKDFVRTSVMDFYEMFRQTASSANDMSAFGFTNETLVTERVCPLDDFEMALKVRNEAMKSSCASVQLDTLKKVLRIIRIVVDKMVEFTYIEFQIIICFFRMLIPGSSQSDINQVPSSSLSLYPHLILTHVEMGCRSYSSCSSGFRSCCFSSSQP